MKAELVFKIRFDISDDSFAEMVAWQLPEPLRGSSHNFKYRLAFIEDEVCVLRYDNETGKGDHKHVGKREFDYHFVGLKELEQDFRAEIERLRK